MIKPSDFYNLLIKNDINLFTGVPDSLLKDFSAYVMDNSPSDKHIITANEGYAIALSTWYHLANGKF